MPTRRNNTRLGPLVLLAALAHHTATASKPQPPPAASAPTPPPAANTCYPNIVIIWDVTAVGTYYEKYNNVYAAINEYFNGIAAGPNAFDGPVYHLRGFDESWLEMCTKGMQGNWNGYFGVFPLHEFYVQSGMTHTQGGGSIGDADVPLYTGGGGLHVTTPNFPVGASTVVMQFFDEAHSIYVNPATWGSNCMPNWETDGAGQPTVNTQFATDYDAYVASYNQLYPPGSNEQFRCFMNWLPYREYDYCDTTMTHSVMYAWASYTSDCHTTPDPANTQMPAYCNCPDSTNGMIFTPIETENPYCDMGYGQLQDKGVVMNVEWVSSQAQVFKKISPYMDEVFGYMCNPPSPPPEPEPIGPYPVPCPCGGCSLPQGAANLTDVDYDCFINVGPGPLPDFGGDSIATKCHCFAYRGPKEQATIVNEQTGAETTTHPNWIPFEGLTVDGSSVQSACPSQTVLHNDAGDGTLRNERGEPVNLTDTELDTAVSEGRYAFRMELADGTIVNATSTRTVAAPAYYNTSDDGCSVCPTRTDCPGRNTQSTCEANPACTWCLNPMDRGGRRATPECRVACTCDDVEPDSSHYFGALLVACANGTAVKEWPPVSSGIYGGATDTSTISGTDYLYGASGGLDTCTCNDTAPSPPLEGGGGQDPHLALAYGGRADFRGRSGVLYNVLSSEGASVNVRTDDALFKLREVTVHGSFLTEAHVVARTLAGRLLRISPTADRLGPTGKWRAVDGACGDEAFTLDPKGSRACDELTVSIEYSTLTVATGEWNIKVMAQPVYGRLAGTHHRLDVAIEALAEEEAHGLIGQSFDGSEIPRFGRVDQYPPLEIPADFVTSAMAEGAIEGVAADYEMSDKYSVRFKYSRFVE